MQEGENIFSYYDLSSRDNVAEKRCAFNEWASRMPESERVELRQRMMSSTGEFYASETELVIHEMLYRLGFSIEIHPVTPSGKRIDFLASRRDEHVFFEVTTILTSKDAEAAQNRKAILINAINEIQLPAGHCFGFDIEEAGPTSPNTREFRKKIERWVTEKIPADTKEFPVEVFADRGGRLRSPCSIQDLAKFTIAQSDFKVAKSDSFRQLTTSRRNWNRRASDTAALISHLSLLLLISKISFSMKTTSLKRSLDIPSMR